MNYFDVSAFFIAKPYLVESFTVLYLSLETGLNQLLADWFARKNVRLYLCNGR